MRRAITRCVLATALVALGACGAAKTGAKSPAPAKTEALAHESELLKLKLTPEAVRRLDIVSTPVVSGALPRSRTLPGEVIPAALGAAGYAAFPSAPGGDLAELARRQIEADGEVRRAGVQAETARLELARTERLLAEDAASVRERDRAREQLEIARSTLQAAQARRSLLGPAAQSAQAQRTLWVRAAVHAAELASLDPTAPATVRELGADGSAPIPARPVNAPPSADVRAASVDLYYAIANPGGRLRVGQRVAVAAPLRTRGSGLVVPWSAVLHDINGGEWVYERTAPTEFVRRRVQVADVSGGLASLASGPKLGAQVVVQGAAELFGTEFGVGK